MITGCYSRLKKDNVLIPNLNALIEDFQLLGADIIDNIILSDKHKNNN